MNMMPTALCYPHWKDDEQKRFVRKVFWTAFIIRAVYAFVMCYYYYWETGIGFEYDAGDSLWYHSTGVMLSHALREGHLLYVLRYLRHTTMGFSDQGYVLWLTLVYTIFGRNWLVPRLLKALMGAYLCHLIYKLGSRTFGERYHEAAVPLIVLMSAYSMTHLRHKDLKWFYAYCVVLFAALLFWNWLKLSARGLA